MSPSQIEPPPAGGSAQAPGVPVYDSAKRRVAAIDELVQLFAYHNLVVQMTRRDIVSRYKRSLLGVAWTMLNPLGISLILTVVFSQVFGATGGYAAYVLSGLVAWNFFSQTSNGTIWGMIWGGNLMKRIYIPRMVFAVSALGTGLVNLGLALIPTIVIMMLIGVPVKSTILFLPVPVLFLAMFTLGMGLLVSAFGVFFADVAEIYQLALTAWMYLSPVIYKLDFLPPQWLWIVRLNPMFYLINLFRAPLYDGRIPSLEEIAVCAAISTVTLLVGWMVFSLKVDELAYSV
jgi:ABC-type polysaccharide/polyol phosphate export permease